MTVRGVLLAAGAGRRMGGPKALLRDRTGVPYLDRAVGALLDGGCEGVTVVLGAAADEAAKLLEVAGWSDDPAVEVVLADDWDEGMGASLRTGLEAVRGSDADAVLVTLVDLPDVGADVVRRLTVGASAAALVRAAYDGTPGHPVLLGRDHWAGVAAVAAGDRGARDYLASHHHDRRECGDLATGRDLDHPADLDRPDG